MIFGSNYFKFIICKERKAGNSSLGDKTGGPVNVFMSWEASLEKVFAVIRRCVKYKTWKEHKKSWNCKNLIALMEKI